MGCRRVYGERPGRRWSETYDPAVFTTERLRLRRWQEGDVAPFAAMSVDPDVMRYFPSFVSQEDTRALVQRFDGVFDEHGFGPWALEHDGEFVGFTGLLVHTFPAHFTPAVEVGWRLRREAWGRGFATEAAREALRIGFEEHDLDEIVSMTVPANVRSVAVMERLGMTRDRADDFDHPRVEEGSPLRRHVLYRLSRSQWAGS
ncbi:MAG: GNAT family N-acetyltransferase [Acidimicrobiia bacterium]|nr:MAG: GNAT family N-acetyltransferase [Acidimicrobiia bacterium]